MLKYREEKGMPIDSLCSSYIMAFYEYSEASSVYLKQNYRNDINGVTYRLHDDKKYALGSVVVSPSETESCKWSVYVWLYYIPIHIIKLL